MGILKVMERLNNFDAFLQIYQNKKWTSRKFVAYTDVLSDQVAKVNE